MKKLLFLFFFSPLIGLSQTYNYEELYLPLNDGKIRYTDVVQAPGKTKAELFQNSKVWFANTFRSAKDVINFEDEGAGIVSGSGNTSIYIKSLGQTVERTVYFSIKIEVKDERYRYTIDQIEFSTTGLARTPIEVEFSRDYMFNNKGKPRQVSWDWYAEFEPEIIGLETKLKTEISKKAEDW
jgi:hypothetical protein